MGSIGAKVGGEVIQAGSFVNFTNVLSLGSWSETSPDAYVGRRATYSGSATEQVITISSDSQAGNLLFIAARESYGNAVISVTDSQGNTWTVKELVDGAVHIAWTTLTTALKVGDTITITLPEAQYMAAAVYEFTGQLSSPGDVTASANGTGTTATVGPTAETSQADEIALSVVTVVGGSLEGYTAPADYTVRDSSFNSVQMATKMLTAQGEETTSWIVPSATSWGAMIQTFKLSSPVPTGIYYTTCATEPTRVTFDGELLVKGGSTNLGANEWYWAGDVLYVNVGGDPSSGAVVAYQNRLVPQRTTPFSGVLFDETYPSPYGDFGEYDAAPGAITNVSDPLGSGETVLKMVVNNADVSPVTPTGDPRAQVSTYQTINDGDVFWVKFKYLLPAGFPESGITWLQLFQIFGPPFGSGATVALDIDGVGGEQVLCWKRLDTYSYDFPFLMSPIYDEWVEVLYHVKFASEGWVELWVNGEQITFFEPGASINPNDIAPTKHLAMATIDAGKNDGSPNYVYLQSYREVDSIAGDVTVYFGSLNVGNTRHSVGG